uniref:Transcriptional regulator ATRX homolog n=1 Tax=Bursaphelenchus xylophilus TaxID=6326 RepID=A0A1I7S7N8_BURXY
MSAARKEFSRKVVARNCPLFSVRPKKHSSDQSSKAEDLSKSKKTHRRNRSSSLLPPNKRSSESEKHRRKSQRSKKSSDQSNRPRSLSSDELWQKCITQLEEGSEDAKRLHELAMQTAALEAEKLEFRRKVLEKRRPKNGVVKEQKCLAEERARLAGVRKDGRYKETDVEMASDSNLPRKKEDLSEASCARAVSSRALSKSKRPKKRLKREYDENSDGPIDDLRTGSKERRKATEYFEAVENSKRARKSKKDGKTKKVKKEAEAKKLTKHRKSTKNEKPVDSSSNDKSGRYDGVADKPEREYYFGGSSSEKVPSTAIRRRNKNSADESEKLAQKAREKTKKRLEKTEQTAVQKIISESLTSREKSVEKFENEPHRAQKKKPKNKIDREKYRSTGNRGNRRHRSSSSDAFEVKDGRCGGRSKIFDDSNARRNKYNTRRSEGKPDVSRKKRSQIRRSASSGRRPDEKAERSASQRPSFEKAGVSSDDKQLKNSAEKADDQNSKDGYSWPTGDPTKLLEVKNEKPKKENASDRQRPKDTKGSKKTSKSTKKTRSSKKSKDLSSQSSVSTIIDPAELICCRHGRVCPDGKREQKAERKRRRSKKIKEKKKRTTSSKTSQSKKSAHSLKRVFPADRRKKSKSSATRAEIYEEAVWDERTTRTCKEKESTHEMNDTPVEPVQIEPKKASKKKEREAMPDVPTNPAPDLEGEIAFPEFFLGAMEQYEAEEKCDSLTAFKFYYMIDEYTCFEFLDPYLPLYIVYRDSSGSAWHFPVVQVASGTDNFFYVNYNHRGAPRFRSIAALIRFYSVYVHFHQNEFGEMITDVFPWWYLFGNSPLSKSMSDF